jgi:type IV pilus assembly protein PilB
LRDRASKLGIADLARRRSSVEETAMAKQGKDFTEILIKKGTLGRDQVSEAVSMAQSSGIKVPDAIVRLGYASMDEVMQAMAEQFGMEFVNLEEVQIPSAVIQLVPESVARENVILPMSQDNGALKIIMSDPMDFETVDKLRFILNRDIEIALAPRESIQEAINRHYGQTETESVDSMLQEFTDTAIDFTETEQSSAAAMNVADADAPIVKLVNLIIQEAVNLRASDIHIEPFADRVRVRYRIDGVCVERDSPPRRLLGAMISRIKIMGNIDIAEKRRPQDGRIKMQVSGKDIDLRVSVLPSNHGQSIVMRILNKESIMVGIRELGFSEEDYRRFQTIIKRPNGIFLVTGPTGSGKTTTLYGALAELNRPDKKIITAEEPVEYYLPGINQTEVKSAIGLTFARIIRAMLRQSPNIILVGEIRDKETADMAIQASLTGHLVFSTLHTNDAPSAITRLIDIGVQPFLVASSVMAVMAQRLVRKVCPKCQEPDEPDPFELKAVGLSPEKVKNANFMRGRGCNYCHHTGYRGRIGIFEMMQMNSTLREMSFRREPTQNIRRQARLFGMRTLLEDGVIKTLKGVTTLEEVLETTHHEAVNL